MAQTGLGKGLAVRHDFGADINRLYQTENLRSQVQVEKERKAQMYGEMLRQGHVRGKNNTAKLQEFYKGVNNEFADFVTENPSWETDPGLFAQGSAIADQYLNNDIIREDEQVAQQYQMLQQKAASGTMDLEDINKQMKAYTDYMEKGGDPYMFINPKQLEFSDIIATAVSGIKYDVRNVTYTNAKGIPVTRQIKTPQPGGIQTMTDNIMADKEMRKEAEALWKQPEMKEKFESPQKMVAHNIKIGLATERGREIIDPIYKMNYERNLVDQGIPESHVIDNVVNPLLKIALGEKGVTFHPNQANIALTAFGEPGIPYTITSQDEAYFLGKGKDPTSGSSKDFMLNQYNIRAEASGSQRVVTIDDIAYIATDVVTALPVTDQFNQATDKSTEVLTSQGIKIEKFLQDAGFHTYEGYTEGLGISLLNGKKVKGRYYEGISYMRVDYDDMKLENYDKLSTFGIKDIQGVRRRGDYKRAENTMRSLDEAKPHIKEANALKKEKFHFDPQSGEIISEDGMMGYDPDGPAGNKRYTR